MAQTFNPDNVLVHERKDGTIPGDVNKLIIEEIINGSQIMRLGKYEEMKKKKRTFEYYAEGPGAYWIGEGQKIQTSTAKWIQVEMEAKKLGVIIPVSREFLQYKVPDFFNEVKPKIAEAFYKKFDEAAILNVNNPFAQSIEESVASTNQIVVGDLTYSNILALEDFVTAADMDVKGFASNRKNRSALRGANEIVNGVITERLYDRKDNTLDGVPVAELKSASFEKGTLYGGDMDHIRYGIPFAINYKISEEATLSTLTNEDGTPINLFEQDLVALRAIMDIGFMIIKDEAFAKIEAAPIP